MVIVLSGWREILIRTFGPVRELGESERADSEHYFECEMR